MSMRWIAVANAAAFALALILGLIVGDFDYHFQEHRFITWFSVVQLGATAWVCREVFRIRRVRLWLLLTIGFAFLAIDEGGKVHENIDRTIHKVFRIEETALSDRLDDLLIGLYGVIGLGVLYAYRDELRHYRSARRYVVAAFVLLFVMVGLDLAINRPDLLTRVTGDEESATAWKLRLGVPEEGLKLLGEMMFLFAALECRGVTRKLSAAGGVEPT